MKRRYLVILSIFLIIALSACQQSNVDEKTEEHYTDKGKAIVELLLDFKFEDVYQQFNEEMKEELPASELEELLTPLIKKVEEFEEYEVSAVEERANYFVTVIVTKHEKGKLGFTITFEENGEIAGLYLK